MTRSMLAALVIAPAFLSCAAAGNIPAEGEDARFMFRHIGDGFVRLDTRTGDVAFCSRHSVGFACEAVPEERAAFEAEIARLRAENAALKKEVLTHGLDLPSGVKPDNPGQEGGRNRAVPSDADLDRVMAFLGRAWRRLVDMMSNFQRGS